MKTVLLNDAKLNDAESVSIDSLDSVKSYSPEEVFFCPEESQFYSQCLERMLLRNGNEPKSVIEFGAGDGRDRKSVV